MELLKDPLVFWPLLLFISFGAVIIGAIIKQHKTDNLKLKSLLPGVTEMKMGRSGQAEYAGQIYFYEHFTGSKNNPAYLSIKIPLNTSGRFQVVKERAADVLFKKLGINREVQTGDAEFDKKHYILSDQPEFAASSLSRAESRQAVETIFLAGFSSVECGGGLEAKWEHFRLQQSTDAALVTRVLESLIALSKNIPAEAPQAVIDMMSPERKKVPYELIHAVPYVLGGAGFLCLLWLNASYRMLDGGKFFIQSLAWSLPLLIAFVFFVVRLLSGRSTAGREILTISFAALIGIPLFVYSGGAVYNGAQDHSLPAQHLALVREKHTTTSKNSTHYHVQVLSWRAKAGLEDFTVSQEAYDRIAPNRTWLNVVTRRGALNYEWLESYSIAV